MSKKIVLLGDLGTDHQGFLPTPVIAGSTDVLVDGKPVARVGDPLASHSKPKHPPHPRTIAAGSATVLINGIPAAMSGGVISCGGVTIGSGSVVIGDTHSPVLFSGISPAHTKFTRHAEVSGARASDSSGVNTIGARDPNGSTVNATAGETVASDIADYDSIKSEQTAIVEPGFHVVQRPIGRMELLVFLYGDASAKLIHFDRLNPGLGENVLPGEMIVLGDPKVTECTQEEVDLMEVAAQVNAEVRSLEQDEV